MDDESTKISLDLSQKNIRLKLALYLNELKIHDSKNCYDNDQLIQQLKDPKIGQCSGDTALWIYCILLEDNVSISRDKPSTHSRHDYQWHLKTRRLIAGWNGNIHSLNDKEKKDIDSYLSYIIQFQNPEFYFFLQQNQLENFVLDSKNRCLERRDIISGLFTFGQITQILEELSDKTAAYVGSSGSINHALGIYKLNDYYFFFDTNIPDANKDTILLNKNTRGTYCYDHDVDLICSTNPEDITLCIFLNLKLSNKKYAALEIIEFGFAKINQPKKILWDVNYIQPILEFEDNNTLVIACKANDHRTVKYCLKRISFISEKIYITCLIRAMFHIQDEIIFRLLLEIPVEKIYSIKQQVFTAIHSFSNYMLGKEASKNILEKKKALCEKMVILSACFSGKTELIIKFFEKNPALYQQLDFKKTISLSEITSEALIDFKTASVEILLDFILEIQKSINSRNLSNCSSYFSSMTLFSHQKFASYYKKLAENLMIEIIDSPCNDFVITDIIDNYKIKSQKHYEASQNTERYYHELFFASLNNIQTCITRTISLHNPTINQTTL